MRVKRILLLALAFCTAASSSGCWDATDINNKSLITLVLTARQDDEFVFYFEVPNLSVSQSQDSGSSREQYSIVSGAGATFAEARRHLNAKMDKPVFLGTVRALLVTDELAKHGLEEYMYRMQTMIDYRKTLLIATTRDKPEDVLSVKPENNVSIGYSIEETIRSNRDLGKVVTYTVSDVFEFLYSGYCFVLINLDVRDGLLAYTGYTIIHNGSYLGFIPLEDSAGLVWLLGDNIERIYVVPLGGVLVTFKVKMKKRDIEPLYADGQITFNISFSFESEALYSDKNVSLDDQALEQVKPALQAQLLEDIAAAIRQSQSFQCDYLGFKEHFRVAYPNILSQISKSDWVSRYMNATFNISAETTLETGMFDFEAQGQSIQ